MTKPTGRTARAAFNATLRAIVQFASLDDLDDAERLTTATRLVHQILDLRVTKQFGIVAFPDMRATEDGPVVDVPPPNALQAPVRALLADVVADRRLFAHGPPGAVSAVGHGVGPLTVTPGVTAYGPASTAADHHLLSISGPFRDVFLWMVCALLARSATHTILACPECGRPFYKVRTQTRCSTKCYDRAYWRDYPANKKRRARKNWYASHGWTLGARSKKKTRRATRA